MDKKLNRTIGYVKTIEVVKDVVKTTKVVKKKQVNNLKSITVPAIGELINKDLKPVVDNIEVTNNTLQAKIKPFLTDNSFEVVNTTVKEEKAILEPVISLEYRSKRIMDWLENHYLINKAGLCQAVGLDKSNFKRLMLKEKVCFKLDVLIAFEKILKQYGY